MSMRSAAYSDLTECINKNLTLKTDLDVDQWVSSSIVGPSTKASPIEVFTPPKTGAVTEAPKVVHAEYDVVVTTTSGAQVHRYEEVAPGIWKYKATLTAEDAFKHPPQRGSAAQRHPRKSPTESIVMFLVEVFVNPVPVRWRDRAGT